MSRTIRPTALFSATALAATLALLAGPLPAQEGLEAQLDWGERYRVTAPVAGIVRKVEIRPGAHVEAGATLFRLDTRRIDADLRAAEAAVERLELELAEADREVSKAQDLYDQTLIAARELELARIEQATVAARLTEARARYDQARADHDDATLRAPASGRVTRVHVQSGEYVNPALVPPVLAELGTTDPMRATALVPATRLSELDIGQDATVVVNDTRHSGEITALGWERVEAESGTGYRIEVTFEPQAGASLRAGLPARIEFDHRN
ncbi:MAG: efflux RND transporter periplasmic adaptor subunit [Pseudomonadota bacterium]